MCGIAGIIAPAESPERRQAAVDAMCAAMKHRGPDFTGSLTRGATVLGMTRLAIIDPAGGAQPMTSACGSYHLVFNGCIYNYREIRAELAAGGYPFRTQCDTEVLLAAFAGEGAACLRRLRGMFAFALWDEQERRLLLARDPFGIKPLYFCPGPGRLLFASELNALHASRLVPRAVDPAAAADYLAHLAVPAPRTIYRDVFSLRPGEMLTWQEGRITLSTYWRFPPAAGAATRTGGRGEFIEALRARLADTVKAHQVADVPVGAFLSGGLDSSGIVGLMRRAGAAQLKTFSIGFGEAGYSEADVARRTAAQFGTEHHELVLTGARVAEDFGKILRTLDQPTGDGINTYYVSRAAHEGGVRVALSGLGGDELFGGYPSFTALPRLARWLPAWRLLPAGLRRLVTGPLRTRGARGRKLADFLDYAHDLPELCALQRRVFSEPRRRALLSPDLRAALPATIEFHPQLAALRAELAGADAFRTISAWELRTYMADVLLRDSDVFSMSQSLELRTPFIDRPFIEWLWSQPTEFLRPDGQPKAALAEALAGVVPPEVLARKKQGFTLPFAVWMRHELQPLLDEIFSPASLGRSGLFDVAAAGACWRDFLRGHDAREWSRVWSLAVLVAFANREAAA